MGVGTVKDVFLPRAAVVAASAVKMISSGSHHSGLVTKMGELYVCGS